MKTIQEEREEIVVKLTRIAHPIDLGEPTSKLECEIRTALLAYEEKVRERVEELELSCVDDRLLGKTDEYLEGYNTSTVRWREKRDELLQALTLPITD